MAHVDNERPATYGILAEFLSPTELYEAILKTKEEGYTEIDAFTPYPVHVISEEICNHEKSKVSKIVGTAAILGLATALGMQYWISAVDYPLNIGGRPLASWIAFIPVSFELTVLFSAFTAFGSMMILNGLPEPYHPLFNVERFERASVDRHFLLIESKDSKFDTDSTRAFLQSLGPHEEVMDVDW